MSVLLEVWHTILTIVTSADAFTLSLIALLGVAAAFAMDRVHSFTGTTLAALLLFGLAKFALALGAHPERDIERIAAELWQSFATMPMLVFSAYAVIFAAIIGAVAIIRAAWR